MFLPLSTRHAGLHGVLFFVGGLIPPSHFSRGGMISRWWFHCHAFQVEEQNCAQCPRWWYLEHQTLKSTLLQVHLHGRRLPLSRWGSLHPTGWPVCDREDVVVALWWGRKRAPVCQYEDDWTGGWTLGWAGWELLILWWPWRGCTASSQGTSQLCRKPCGAAPPEVLLS